MQRGEVKVSECEVVRRALLAGRELTAAEVAHAEACEACADAVTEIEIEAALMVQPRVEIPEGFAARVTRELPQRQGARRWARQKLTYGLRLGRHVGRDTAVALLLGMMLVVTMSDPRWFAGMPSMRMTWPGMVWMLVLAGEVAGVALWLGLRSEI